jgi:hypothetical protein
LFGGKVMPVACIRSAPLLIIRSQDQLDQPDNCDLVLCDA